MMNVKQIALLATLTLGMPALVACEEEGPIEKAAEKTDDALEDAGDAIEDAADEVKDAVDD